MSTGRDVLAAISSAPAGAEWWGDADAPVRHVIVSWSAHVDAIRRSAAHPGTLLISRVHPWFAPPTGIDPAIVRADPDWEGRMRSDPVALAKRDLVERSGTTLAMAPDAWDALGADQRSLALAERLDLGPARRSAEPSAAVLELLKPIAVGALALLATDRLNAPRAYLIGEKARAVRRVAVVAGLASPAQLSRVRTADRVDAVVVGETVEWEGAPYAQDTLTAGFDVPLIAVGNAVSEGPRTEALATLLRDRFPDLAVDVADTPEASWTPTERRTA